MYSFFHYTYDEKEGKKKAEEQQHRITSGEVAKVSSFIENWTMYGTAEEN